MKITIVGSGAIGGMLGVRLGQAGHAVSVIARGANLEAISARGLRLIAEDGAESAITPAIATDRIADLSEQDVVFLGVKAHQVAAVASDLPAMFHETTIVVTAQNGVPWWYFHKHGGAFEGRTLESVDPGGYIASQIPIERVIGSIAYPAAEIIQPGIIKHIEGNRFSVGEIDGGDTPRVRSLSQVLREAGFKAPVLSDIRAEIWTKLWGNLSFNPISALTHATLVEICQFSPTRELAARMMREAQEIAEKLGVRFKVSLEKRIAGAEAVGSHKTSMLQDIEAGREPEIAALVGSVAELGRITGVATPYIDAILATTNLLAKTLHKRQGVLQVQPR
jgi:2-dehydropantoate 2-reductase